MTKPSTPAGSAVALRQALGVILLAAALGVLNKAGLAVPPAAIVAIPVATAALVAVAHRRREGKSHATPVRS